MKPRLKFLKVCVIIYPAAKLKFSIHLLFRSRMDEANFTTIFM